MVTDKLEVPEGQISIFDVLDEKVETERVIVDPVSEIKKGDLVKVRQAKPIESYGHVEDYYYIKQFEGKKGEVFDIRISELKVLSFAVMMSNGQPAWFYEGELIYV